MKNRKGFTLMELLIVIAIIVVLVAIAIPVFCVQLEKSREATDMANIRSAYSRLMFACGDDSTVDTSKTFDTSASTVKYAEGKVLIGMKNSKKYYVTSVKLSQTVSEWQSIPSRPGLMIGEMEFWLSSKLKKNNYFYFCVNEDRKVDKTFWGILTEN